MIGVTEDVHITILMLIMLLLLIFDLYIKNLTMR